MGNSQAVKKVKIPFFFIHFYLADYPNIDLQVMMRPKVFMSQNKFHLFAYKLVF